MKTLKEFLKRNQACEDGFDFAKDLTLEQFLKTCERGDWILWLFAKMNPDSLRELTLAKAHCANTVRHLMKDQRSIKAVDIAIAFGEGRKRRATLDAAAAAAAAYAAGAYADVTYSAGAAAYAAAYAAGAAAYAAGAAAGAAAYAAGAAYVANVARIENRKLTAEICRKYLPLKIWNNN